MEDSRAMRSLSPVELAKRQIALDRARTKRLPDLFERKRERMAASPLAFLRGAAPLFYEILAARPDLEAGPAGEGWIVGDAHLENFGAYRPDPVVSEGASEGDGPPSEKSAAKASGKGKKKANVTFSLNDFDDATIGPWRFDVLRLATSVLLAARELGAGGAQAVALARHLVDAHSEGAFGGAESPEPPPPVAALVDQVRARSRHALLDARAPIASKGVRRFARGPRYRDLPRATAAQAATAFTRYVAALPADERPAPEQIEVQDCALRVAGTGSLGALRVAVLVRGKGGLDGGWIFDMKEQGDPSSAPLVKPPPIDAAERVVRGFRACVDRAPRMLGTTRLGGLSMLVRKLSPQEDKLNLRRLDPRDVIPLARYLGGLLGAAHARGVAAGASGRGVLPRAWTASERSELLDRAIELAGIHEAVYLALAKTAAP
jgi:uncharacterized protein (DUF2252 family)